MSGTTQQGDGHAPAQQQQQQDQKPQQGSTPIYRDWAAI